MEMEALNPLASVHPLASDPPEAVAHAAHARGEALGAPEAVLARLERLALLLAQAPHARESAGELLLAPLRTPWGGWVDVVRVVRAPAPPASADAAVADVADEVARAVLPAGTFGSQSEGLEIVAARVYAAPPGDRGPVDLAGFVRAYPGLATSGARWWCRRGRRASAPRWRTRSGTATRPPAAPPG
jgi:hypothetical protein